MTVFGDMAKGGCQLNTVLYTMLIKGFVRAGDRPGAMKVYKQMREESQASIKPDLITFSILIKANCDDEHIEEALVLMGEMIDLGLKPDEVIFNNLIGGCGQNANVKLGRQLYNDMVKSGIRPSNVTFSILIRMYQKSKLLEEAVLLLKSEPAKHRVEPETRLFIQLIQGCVRGRQGKRAVEVYEMLCQSSKPTAKSHNIILNTCMTVNMYDTAVEIMELAASKQAHVDVSDANAIAEGVLKKGKGQLLRNCVASMQALGLPVDPKFRIH
jgi:pentatricopeptide repeat protein